MSEYSKLFHNEYEINRSNYFKKPEKICVFLIILSSLIILWNGTINEISNNLEIILHLFLKIDTIPNYFANDQLLKSDSLSDSIILLIFLSVPVLIILCIIFDYASWLKQERCSIDKSM